MPELVLMDLCFHDRGPYSLQVAAGECLGLQGVSGAGKSMLLRAIADLDPRTGSVRLGEVDMDQVTGPVWRRQVGLLLAESGWWFDLVGEHFEDFDQVEEKMLRQLGFDRAVGDWAISRLSTGEKQRLAILRLLSNQPRCLLLDEPTASLDQQAALQVEELLLAYRREHEAPVIWVSHDPAQLSRVSDQMLFMDHQGHLSPQWITDNAR